MLFKPVWKLPVYPARSDSIRINLPTHTKCITWGTLKVRYEAIRKNK